MPRGMRTSPLGSREVPGSPYSLRVLQEGYSVPQSDGGLRADGSITLIRGGPVTVLVDTGGPWGRRRLLRLLAGEGLRPGAVTHVVCTHGHSDHVGNLNLFPAATVVVGFDVSRGEGRYLPPALGRGRVLALDAGRVEVVATPGHTASHVSVAVRGTALGTALVAGDLFEREGDGEEWRALSEDAAAQERSRRWALAEADVIVPGHGPAFRVFRHHGGDGGGGATPGGDPEEEEGTESGDEAEP